MEYRMVDSAHGRHYIQRSQFLHRLRRMAPRRTQYTRGRLGGLEEMGGCGRRWCWRWVAAPRISMSRNSTGPILLTFPPDVYIEGISRIASPDIWICVYSL